MNTTALQLSPSAAPWLQPWPSDELERVLTCPACSSLEREVLHEGLVDNVFFVAPGKWTLHRCTRCASAYLDPCPSPASIHKAYGTYYTHAAGPKPDDTAQIGRFRRVRRVLANGYLNHKYGTDRQPASAIGRWVAKLVPKQRQNLDVSFRYLPKAKPGQRLLDIGCGNGDFLSIAREAGWQVEGVEPDRKAASIARARGFDIKTGTDELTSVESSCLDAVTMSHVIEHVHQPRQLLKSVYRLLKPGGSVYVDTPNILSHGAKLFGAQWRGIEAPRHLVVFSPAALANLLTEVGFRDITYKRRTCVQLGMFQSSARIASGHSPYNEAADALDWLQTAKLRFAFTATSQLEFITLVAWKTK